MKNKIYSLIYFLFVINGAFGQQLSLIKDINKGTNHGLPEYLTLFNNKIYFVANDGMNGTELWETDGTEKNTKLVLDINPNGDANVRSLVVMDNELYFAADNGTNGLELWKSDGTANGTQLVKDIYPGVGGSLINHLYVYNNKLYFQAGDNSTVGIELWESDGTTAGTKLFMDINTTGDYQYSSVKNFATFNGKMYFSASDGVNGEELWVSDGTIANTLMLKDINTNANLGSSPSGLTVYNNKLYFAADEGSSIGLVGRELWETDGTTAGTKLTSDIQPGVGDSAPQNFIVFNNKLYFSASYNLSGQPNSELWKYDDSTNTSSLVEEINEVAFIGSGPSDLTEYNGKIYFEASKSNALGSELWQTDGTNTILALDINTRDQSSGVTSSSLPENFIVYKNMLFFSATTGTYGRELYVLNPISLATLSPDNITKTTANLGGNIAFQGASVVTERGIVYARENVELKIGRQGVIKESIGNGDGPFTKTITLNQGTIYYYRAYAINSEGTVYGNTETLHILDDVPTINTIDASNITAISSTLNAEIIDSGNSSIIQKGFVYSTSNTSPKLDENNVFNRTNSSNDALFSSSISSTNLKTYFYRAYAKNNEGIGYGDVKTFRQNNALHFNGGNEKITVNDNSNFDFSSGITLEAWINIDQLNTDRNIIRKYEDAVNGKSFNLWVDALGRFRFTISIDGSSDEFLISNSPAIFTNNWHHIAATFNGSTMKMYVDGLGAGSKSVTGTIYDSSSDIVIGEGTTTSNFSGALDEIRIWDKALSQQEVKDLKDVIIPEQFSNIIAYYNFNQGIANGSNNSITAIVEEIHNLNGALSGFQLIGSESNFVTGVASTFSNRNPLNTFNISGNWSNPNNWSSGVVPDNIDDIIIESNKTVTIDIDDLVVEDFTLQNGATLSIPSDKEITVQKSFVTDGNLEISSDESNSGVLFIKGTTEGEITYKRGGLEANKWHIITPPISGQKIHDFVNFIPNNIKTNENFEYAVGTYNDNLVLGNKWQYYDGLNPDFTLEFIAGQSYAISKVTDGFITFKGTLNTSNLNKTVTAGKWNAVGNPFTTYYPANRNNSNSFLNENLDALDDAYKSLYIWDNSQNKYAAVTELDLVNQSLPPGQGFFVKLKNGESNILFNENKRSIKPESGNTEFEKNRNKDFRIELKISNENNTVKTTLIYSDTATNEFDIGYDIANFNSANLDIYSILANYNDDINYTIQSLDRNSALETIIPLGVIANSGQKIHFSASALNLPENTFTYLEDKELNNFYKIDKDNKYSIDVSPSINGSGRFYLHLSNKTLNSNLESLSANFSIYQKNKYLYINGITENNIELKIYSIIGKKVFGSILNNSKTKKVSLVDLKSGVYIVDITTNSGKYNKKIILK
ncbi:T9SS type A sorting domain-containing protein [Polaribacter vadi]|uniref:ELWxxDGT repeat protein n=1 Tax=Polaribacter TaxID=52959 RepID=UPI001C09D19B|nr:MULTISPECIES: ELWxxDGT repeat protein [Polaribacter]MBU3010852.1 T9SS type A sorting domain-containing protein [Polaribacter vadi]MDO6740664.1 LamG-like jellyroll fold domain-containing protein [Polaribacter sp. 1_MG-2023]